MEDSDSEFANFTLPTLKTILEAECVWQQAVTCCSCYRMPQTHFFHKLVIFWSAEKWRKDSFSTLHPLFPVIFASATVVAFALLHNSRFSFHCYTQREATPTQKMAQKWCCDLSWLLPQILGGGGRVRYLAHWLYSTILCFQADPLSSSSMQLWMCDCSFA